MLGLLRKQLLNSSLYAFGNSSFHLNVFFSSRDTSSPRQEVKGVEAVDKKVFITLIGPDGYTKTSTVEAAEKISLKRGLKLIKVRNFDPKRRTPVYKLMDDSFAKGQKVKLESCSGKTISKREKSIHVSSCINDHDLRLKLQQVVKWLQKNHGVNAIFYGSPSEGLAEALFRKIVQAIKNNGRIVQKITEKGVLKLQMIPAGGDGKPSGKDEKPIS